MLDEVEDAFGLYLGFTIVDQSFAFREEACWHWHPRKFLVTSHP